MGLFVLRDSSFDDSGEHDVDPWGEVIARAGEGEQVLLAELDMNRLLHLREEFPVLKDRRLGTRGYRLSEPTLSTFAEGGS